MDKKSFRELIVVIAILGILVAVAVPRVECFRSIVEERVFAANRKTVERFYNMFLLENEYKESEFN